MELPFILANLIIAHNMGTAGRERQKVCYQTALESEKHDELTDHRQ